MKSVFYSDFQKGYNDTISPEQMGNNEMAVAENIDLSEQGGFSNRMGCAKYNSTSFGGKVTQAFEWIIGSTTRDILVVNKGTDGIFVGILDTDKNFVSKQKVLSQRLAHCVVNNVLYFGDREEMYTWGAYDFIDTQGTKVIYKDDIVKYSNNGGFYKYLLTGTYYKYKDSDGSKEISYGDIIEVVSTMKFYKFVCQSGDYYNFKDNQGSQTVTVGTIVKKVSTGQYYKSLISGSVDLSTEDYTEATRWTNITGISTVDLSTENYSDTKRWVIIDGATQIDLTTTDFLDTSKWLDVTGVTDIISDDIRVVRADTSADNDLSKVKKCAIFTYHPASFRMFAARNVDDPSALYFSEPNNPTYFKETNVMYPTNNLGAVTALVAFGQSLLVSYVNQWFAYTGTDPDSDATTWKKLPIPYGAISHDSVALTPNSITFATRNNIYCVSAEVLNQQTVIQESSQVVRNISKNKVVKTLKGILNYGTPFDSEGVRAVFYDNKYYLAFRDDTSIDYNNKILVYDWENGGCSLYTGWEHYFWIPKSDGRLLFASRNYILETQNGYSDINCDTGEKKAIVWTATTKYFDLGAKLNRKFAYQLFMLFRQSRVTGQKSDINIKIKFDYGSFDIENVNLLESFVWGDLWGSLWGTDDLIEKAAEINECGLNFQIQISNDELDNHVTVYGIGFSFDVLEANPNFIPGIEEELLK